VDRLARQNRPGHRRAGCLSPGLGTASADLGLLAQFFPTPGRIKAYLSGQWRGEGHNPLGALSVFGLLGVLGVQLTGLVANDDIAFRGPLYDLVGNDGATA
jgi:cytochrome b